MMQSHFQIAFTVEVLHSYFEQSICQCLQFSPGIVTRKLLKRFNLKCNYKTNGFDFYVNTNESLPAFLQYINTATRETYFDFGITTNNTAFNLFTELPANQVGQLVYDSQSPSNLYQDGVVQLAEYLSENPPMPDLGTLLIRFDDILKFKNDTGYAQFDIQFKARSTQWQYYIINKSSIALDNPAISKSDIQFTGPENVTTESGQPALLFSSGDFLIPLSEKPKYKFDLVNTPATNGGVVTQKKPTPKIICKGLPNPDPERIGMTSVNGINHVSSPMYVYV